jgi:hypothetical protein
MTSITIKINCENSALTEDCEGELSRILRSIASDVLLHGIDSQPIIDVNGNTVGEIVVEGDKT